MFCHEGLSGPAGESSPSLTKQAVAFLTGIALGSLVTLLPLPSSRGLPGLGDQCPHPGQCGFTAPEARVSPPCCEQSIEEGGGAVTSLRDNEGGGAGGRASGSWQCYQRCRRVPAQTFASGWPPAAGWKRGIGGAWGCLGAAQRRHGCTKQGWEVRPVLEQESLYVVLRLTSGREERGASPHLRENGENVVFEVWVWGKVCPSFWTCHTWDVLDASQWEY